MRRGQNVPAVEFRNVSKRFGSVLANDRVHFSVAQASIHGIVGENGAGKSTAMNILYGLHRRDSGEILVNGRLCSWAAPADAIASGIGMVHQHFMLAGRHTALDNIILGAEIAPWGFLNRKKARARLESLIAQHGLACDLDRAVEEFPVGIQQRIEILKLLYRGARILILDEPTAVLAPPEVDELFRNLKQLRDEGKTILLVTHKLREVIAFTDRVTVMRAGKVTGESNTSGTSVQELADLMVGRSVNLKINVSQAAPVAEPALEITRLSARNTRRQTLRDLSFVVRRGEIVGLAGVEGNGQSELINAVLHPNEPEARSSGWVKILGQDVSNWPSKRIRALGVALIPEDRHQEGLLLDQTLVENFALGLHSLPVFRDGGFLNWSRLSATADQTLAAFDVRPANLTAPAGQLSGGNQQKLVVAREFFRDPQLLIAAQPTRGVDVGGIEFIHQQIVRARDKGAGVLLISSELEEILALSDRILVMFEGRIVGEFYRNQVDERELGLRLAGIHPG